MSITLDRPATAWQAQPGWGISVDLTPRQVKQARQVRVHQRLIGLGLLLVLLACIGTSLLAHAGRSAAQSDYDAEQARTADLASEIASYADVTAAQNTIARAQDDLATVMAGDVDVVNLMARIIKAVPPGVSIGDAALVLTAPDAATTPAADATADPAAGTGADATTTPDPAAPAAPAAPQVIGTLTLTGSATQVAAVTPFVSALNGLRGAVDVLPTSVSNTETGTTYTITLNLTDALHTGTYEQEASP